MASLIWAVPILLAVVFVGGLGLMLAGWARHRRAEREIDHRRADLRKRNQMGARRER